MSVKSPNADKPYGLSGGADGWDGLAGGILSADYFAEAGPEPGEVTFVSISSTTYASRTNTTVTAPTGIADDDFLLLTVLTAANPTAPAATAPGGFTEIGSSIGVTSAGFNLVTRSFYKRASGESGNYTVTHAAGSSQANIAVFRGVDWDTGPLDATQTQNSGTGTTRVWTGLTTVTANAMVVAAGFDWGDTSNNLTPPSGMTEALDNAISYVAHELRSTAGATGGRSHASNSGALNPWGARLIALRPSAGAGETIYKGAAGFATIYKGAAGVAGLYRGAKSLT